VPGAGHSESLKLAERAGLEPAGPLTAPAQQAGIGAEPVDLCQPAQSVHFARKVASPAMTRMPVTRARRSLSDVVSSVAFGGDRVVLSRNGRDLAVIVPMDLYRLLELEEDRLDVVEVRRAKRQAATRGEKPVPYEEARERLGLTTEPAAPRSRARKRK
jgi:prevent-host-death family protein